jgi:hypothetical protein
LSPFFERFFILGGPGGFGRKNFRNWTQYNYKAGPRGFNSFM